MREWQEVIGQLLTAAGLLICMVGGKVKSLAMYCGVLIMLVGASVIAGFWFYGIILLVALAGLWLAVIDNRFENKADGFQGFAAKNHWAAVYGDTMILPLVSAITLKSSHLWEQGGVIAWISSFTLGGVFSILHHLVKPRRIQRPSHWYNVGSYVFPKAGFLHLPFMAVNIGCLILLYGWSGHSPIEVWNRPDHHYWVLARLAHRELLLITGLLIVFLYKGIWKTDGHYYLDGKPRLSAKLSFWLGAPALLYLCWYMW